MVKLFNYLDRDGDKQLKYADFVAMCQEGASGYISLPDSQHFQSRVKHVNETGLKTSLPFPINN